VSDNVIKCAEVAGKTIRSLQLYSSASSLGEVVLEFTDGTTFTASCESQLTMKATLIRTGIGEPEVLKTFAE